MKLRSLLEGLNLEKIHGSLDLEIGGLRSDSRRVRTGDLFVAIRGLNEDGGKYISQAISSGAVAVICEESAGLFPSVTCVHVQDTRKLLAVVADRFHGQPSARLKTIGITGTNGKTTTSLVVASILEQQGFPTGVIGTLSYRVGERILPANHTTPGADELQSLMAQMVVAGNKAVVMEVSSHALDQRRVDTVRWDVAVFTNLTQDHLDYHQNLEKYFDAKACLFKDLDPKVKSPVAVLNRDDQRFERLSKLIPNGVKVISYGWSEGSDFRAVDPIYSVEGTKFKVHHQSEEVEFETSLCGAHNVSNILGALGVTCALGLDWKQAVRGVRKLECVPGRLERVAGSESVPFTVFVDYAHTDDALRRVLNTVRPFTRGRLFVVFGCGGGRDRSKRPLMGRAVAESADFAWITSDNPRQENPREIIHEVIPGFDDKRNFSVVVDRREAISQSLLAAKPGDVVVIAGKGHEVYQEIQGTRMPFDDRQVTREILEDLKNGKEGVWKN